MSIFPEPDGLQVARRDSNTTLFAAPVGEYLYAFEFGIGDTAFRRTGRIIVSADKTEVASVRWLNAVAHSYAVSLKDVDGDLTPESSASATIKLGLPSSDPPQGTAAVGSLQVCVVVENSNLAEPDCNASSVAWQAGVPEQERKLEFRPSTRGDVALRIQVNLNAQTGEQDFTSSRDISLELGAADRSFWQWATSKWKAFVGFCTGLTVVVTLVQLLRRRRKGKHEK